MRCLTQSGFTLIELLVTLVLLGLVAMLAFPAVDSWFLSRQLAAERNALANELAGLPLKANISGNLITITTPDQLASVDNAFAIKEPIFVLSNGYCVGGSFHLVQDDVINRYTVTSPFCDVKREP